MSRPKSYVGASVRESRKKAGFSLRDLGKRVGLSAACLSDIEHNHRNPPAETLRRIATALKAEILMEPFTCSACKGNGVETLPRLWRN